MDGIWGFGEFCRSVIGIGILCILILVLRKIFRNKLSRKFIYAMWIAVPVFLLLCPFLRLPAPRFAEDILTRAEKIRITESFAKDERGGSEYAAGDTATIVLQSGNREQMTALSGGDSSGSYNDAMQSEERIEQSKPVANGAILWTIYLCGLLGIGILFAFVNIIFSMRCRRDRVYLCHSTGCNIRVYRLKWASTPFLHGKSIYVPEEITEEALRFAILHEEAHYKHGDSFWVMVRYGILALFLFHPLVWIAFKYSGYDCELACDESVLSRLQERDRKAYGVCLLDSIKQSRSLALPVVSTNMGSGKSLTKMRIENIVKRYKRNVAAMFLAVVLLLCITGCSLMETKQSLSEEQRVSLTEEAGESAEENVLTEEKGEAWEDTCIEEYDIVVLNTEVWSRPQGSTEVEYSVAEEERQYSLLVDKYKFYNEQKHFTTLCQMVRQQLSRELIGKKEGEHFSFTAAFAGTEYLYEITVLKNFGPLEVSCCEAAANTYAIKPYKITGFLNRGGLEAPDGRFYGYLGDSENRWDEQEGFYMSAWSPSVLEPDNGFDYEPANLLERNIERTWSEGAQGYGSNEYIDLHMQFTDQPYAGVYVDEICIVNGYAKDEETWKKNSRVKSMRLYWGGSSERDCIGTIRLEDTREPQYIDLSEFQLFIPTGTHATLSLYIEEVYYEGCEYADTCVTGIDVKYSVK